MYETPIDNAHVEPTMHHGRPRMGPPVIILSFVHPPLFLLFQESQQIDVGFGTMQVYVA